MDSLRLNRSSLSRIIRAASTARSASVSGCGIGREKTAITASPINLSTMRWQRSTQGHMAQVVIEKGDECAWISTKTFGDG